MIRVLLAALFAFAPCSPALAARCVVIRQHAVAIQAVAVQPYFVPVAQDYYYQVSQSLQTEAIIRKAVREELQSALQQQQPRALQQENPALSQSCLACHAGAKNKTGFILDGQGVDESMRLEAIRRVMLPASDPEHMPKGRTVTAEQLGNLIGELVGPKQDQPSNLSPPPEPLPRRPDPLPPEPYNPDPVR